MDQDIPVQDVQSRNLFNHSNLLFRAATLLKRNLLEWIYSLPGAHPVDEAPGEVVSRFRDDTEHVVEAFDFTVDLAGSTVSAAVAIAILATIRRWMARSGCVAEPREPGLGIPTPPELHGHDRDPDLAGDVLDGDAIGRAEHDAGPRITVTGDAVDDLAFDLSGCCQKLMDRVIQALE